MIEFDQGAAKRIQHFIKVHAYAKMIGEREGMSGEELETLEAVSYTHLDVYKRQGSNRMPA